MVLMHCCPAPLNDYKEFNHEVTRSGTNLKT